LTNDGTYAYSWDALGRLRTVTRDSDHQLIASYEYDALGRRIEAKVTNDGTVDHTTRFLYNGSADIEDRNATGSVAEQTVWADGLPVSVDNYTSGKDKRLFLYQDALGSTLAVADSTARVVEAYLYNPYGQPTVIDPGPSGAVNFKAGDIVTPGGSGVVGNPWRFTSQRYDQETGLYQNGARYMSPSLDRFISRDPLGPWGDQANTGNSYGYVGDAPTAETDPSGLQDVPSSFTVSGDVGAVTHETQTHSDFQQAVGALNQRNTIAAAGTFPTTSPAASDYPVAAGGTLFGIAEGWNKLAAIMAAPFTGGTSLAASWLWGKVFDQIKSPPFQESRAFGNEVAPFLVPGPGAAEGTAARVGGEAEDLLFLELMDRASSKCPCPRPLNLPVPTINTRFGVSFIHPNEKGLISGFAEIEPLPGFFDVMAHGTREGKFRIYTDAGPMEVTAQEMAAAIKQYTTWNGEQIRLISCWGGRRPLTGGRPLAGLLAKELETQVLAGNHRLKYTDVEGLLVGATKPWEGEPPMTPGFGWWRLFGPTNQEGIGVLPATIFGR
jgi:RHS repeat-associated protein